MNYFNPYAYQNNVPWQQQPAQQQQTQAQNGGFVCVRNEEEAMNYPVALGNSVIFKDENAPYIYTKTMGFSQLDRPTFEKYRLVKEEVPSNLPDKAPEDSETINSTIDELKAEIRSIWGEIEGIKDDRTKKQPRTTAKRDKDGDD